MEILIKEGNLTVSHKLGSEWPNEITAEQYLKICDALCISISELDNEKTLPTVQTHERKGETI